MEGTRQPGGCDPEQMMEARARRKAGLEGAERQFQQEKAWPLKRNGWGTVRGNKGTGNILLPWLNFSWNMGTADSGRVLRLGHEE